jgi:DNA damage-inducible protein 1
MSNLICTVCTYKSLLTTTNSCSICGSKIDNIIEKRQQIIDNNYREANDIIPELFFPTKMLYFPCWINGKSIKVFIDTGAQLSIMSKKCAEEYEISHLIDYKYTGNVKGVGRQKIIGRIWMVDIDFGQHVLPCSFIILETIPVPIIFGLNSLIAHRCIIDCKNKQIQFGSIVIPFVD